MKQCGQSPILEFDATRKAVIEPGEAYAGAPRLPERAVLCFFNDLVKRVKRRGESTEVYALRGETGPNPIYLMRQGRTPFAVCHPRVGAPLAAATLEALIAMGATKFIACGAAGVLDASIPPGYIILPDSALRDEGTSYHYLRSGRYVRPHAKALAAMRSA